MKKGKVFTMSQIALAGMILVLGAAVWLNTKYSGDLTKKTKYMGETSLVSNEVSEDAVPTSATVQEDYFTTAVSERDEAYKQAEETAQEILDDLEADPDVKSQAADKLSALAQRKVSETQIENLLKAKGFSKSLAVISDTSVTVVVESDGLLAGETVQIQDVVTSVSGVSLNNIKIVTVDG